MSDTILEILPFGVESADGLPIVVERPCKGTCGRVLRIRSEARNRMQRCPECQTVHQRKLKAKWNRDQRRRERLQREAGRLSAEAEMRAAYPALRSLADLLLKEAPGTYLMLRRRLSAEERRAIEQVAWKHDGVAA